MLRPTTLAAGFLATLLASSSHAGLQIDLTPERAVDLESFLAAGGRCGAFDDAPESIERAPLEDAKGTLPGLEATVEIPVAFHVIYKEQRVNGKTKRIGDVTDGQIAAQITVLNLAYAASGYHFTLAGVDRRKSSTWYAMAVGSTAEQSAKATLAKDPAHTLNIYTCAPAGDLLGWAYYPWSAAETSTMHGVVMLYSSLPGGTAAPYNLGHTATHEVGHYLGLYHTFQGGCRSPGDYVNDTPYEASPAFGCPKDRNTCTTAGLDPVRNYMDYTDDACMSEFTIGQLARMKWAVDRYRPGLVAGTRVAGGAGSSRPGGIAPALVLHGARPNPFNPTTTLEFTVAKAGHVSLRVVDVAGREVATLLDGERAAGTHRAVFQGRGLASGAYLAVLRQGDATRTTRLVLLK